MKTKFKFKKNKKLYALDFLRCHRRGLYLVNPSVRRTSGGVWCTLKNMFKFIFYEYRDFGHRIIYVVV